jgi:prepilin-type N-terminal cleavage/methylation domain-containing protein
MSPCRGFTLIELMVAILLLSVGLLGTLGTAALVTRMIGRGQRAAAAATFAEQRLERLRTTGCAAPLPGAEVLYRGRTPVDSATWQFVDEGNQLWRVVLRTSHLTAPNRWRADSLETRISCAF